MPLRDGVLQVSPLLRELIAQLATLAPEGAETKRNTLLRALFLEELSLQPQLALHLPWPAEARMAEICRLLVITPADDRGIEAWADSLAISAKTFQRHFHSTNRHYLWPVEAASAAAVVHSAAVGRQLDHPCRLRKR